MTSRMILRAVCWLMLSLSLQGFPGGEVRCQAADESRCAVLEVFLRGDAEKSAAAREFIEKTYAQRAGLKIAWRDVAAEEKALDRFYKLSEHFKVAKPGLPACYVSGRFEVGWDVETTPKRLEEALTVEVFVREGCPRCAAARPIIFDRLAPQYPGYKFVSKDIASSAENANRLQELAQRYGVAAASVPALHYCGQLKVGYIDEASSFRQWDDVLKAVTVPCTPEKKTSDRGGIPAWMAAVLLAAQPAPELDTDEPPPRAEKPADAADSDAPPPRRELPEEVEPQVDSLALPPPMPASQSDTVTLPVLGEIRWRDWGMPAFTIAVGLIDGFNPCAMWVLLFLLSLLVNLRDRWKILAVAGTFVVISGLAYLAFMSAWLSVAKLVILLRPAQLVLGVLGLVVGLIHIKDFFAFRQGVSLSIPESAKPGLYTRMRQVVMAETLWGAIAGATVLAVLVNIIELLCTAGLPAMYTGILTMQQYPAWLNFLYLLLYIAAYMFDDSVMVAIAVVTLGKHKLQERGGRILKLLGGVVIAGLGAVMIFKPNWLAAVE